MQAYVIGGRPIHFPFLSGTLRYTCETCDAPCCKGTPLGVGRSKELVTLRQAQPSLPLFAAPGFAGSPLLSIAAPKEACWFFHRRERRCRLETTLGREAKPAGCRLFPFHRLRTMGDALVVLPDFMCPIEIGGVDHAGPFSHDEVVLEMHRTQMPARGHAHLPPPRDMDWAKAVRVERHVVRVSERYLDRDRYLSFAEKQMEKTLQIAGLPDDGIDLSPLDRRVRSFLGIDAVSQNHVVRALVSLTGVMRVMASPLPRAEIPKILLALAALSDAYAAMRGSSFSARTVISLFEQRLPLLYLLAHLEERPRLADGCDPARVLARFPAVRAPLVSVLERIDENRARSIPYTLEAILLATGDTFRSPLSFEAVAMLVALGRVLLDEGQFV